MSQLIEQLKKQATYEILGVPQLDAKEFAELIIQECASLFPLQFTDEQYPRRIDKTIKKHFGLYK